MRRSDQEELVWVYKGTPHLMLLPAGRLGRTVRQAAVQGQQQGLQNLPAPSGCSRAGRRAARRGVGAGRHLWHVPRREAGAILGPSSTRLQMRAGGRAPRRQLPPSHCRRAPSAAGRLCTERLRARAAHLRPRAGGWCPPVPWCSTPTRAASLAAAGRGAGGRITRNCLHYHGRQRRRLGNQPAGRRRRGLVMRRVGAGCLRYCRCSGRRPWLR